MQFSASPRGHRILAYNSSRIYVIDVRHPNLEVKREFKILRRPASACIKDDGSLLAVLSSEMQVDLYNLEQSPPRRIKSIVLDNAPRTIALSPCGSVLAAAYEGGIEVSSLNPGALATDRRAVKCDAVDALAFSFDGTQILGTTTQTPSPSTVILTAPYYDPGSHLSEDNLTPLWTTSILFPNTSRDCSHAVLLQDGSQEEASWSFAYDRSFETFRAVRIGDLRNGTTYFTGPIPSEASQAKLLPCTLPAATYHGELVSAGFHGKEVWVYGIPENLDAVPDPVQTTDNSSASPGLGRNNSGRSGNSIPAPTQEQATDGGRIPQWQLLCDKYRNTFVGGAKVSELIGVGNVKWVSGFGNTPMEERLIVTARGISPTRLVTEEEDMDFVDGGRIVLLDFNYGLSDGRKTEITIEVGTDNAEVLEEEQRDMATEVAIVRRRTVAQKRDGRNALLRAATTASRASLVPPLPQDNDANDDDDPLVPRRIGHHPTGRTDIVENGDEGDTTSIEEMEALDAPYAHASPRSGTTLRRAATAAAVNRVLNPRTADGRPIEYRRADGRREHPHESDADNWVPPPPPYQKEDPGDLPAFMRGSSIAPLPMPPPMPPLSRLQSDITPGHTYPLPERSTTVPPMLPQQGAVPALPDTSNRPVYSRMSSPQDQEGLSRTGTGVSAQSDGDDLYDVSPPESPREDARHPVAAPSGSQTDAPWPSANASMAMGPVTPPSQPSEPASPPSATSAQSPNRSTRHEMRPQAPALELHIPQPTWANGQPMQESSSSAPAVRRLSNAQTWPAGPGLDPAQVHNSVAGFPYTAPVSNPAADDLSADLPPLPSSGQMASLNKRISQGNPRRLSGGFQVPRRPVGTGLREASSSSSRLSHPPASAGSWHTSYSEPDQPLIISTPRGVTGAFDPPGQLIPGRGINNETPLLAPIPRHPRPGNGSSPRPTVERLETIYSIGSTQGGAQHMAPQPYNPGPHQSTSSLLPAWLTLPSVPTNRTSPGINRRTSRAERSAAKNMQDAKKRGWKAKPKTKKRQRDADAGSSAGWTDVTARSTMKDKRCVVM